MPPPSLPPTLCTLRTGHKAIPPENVGKEARGGGWERWTVEVLLGMARPLKGREDRRDSDYVRRLSRLCRDLQGPALSFTCGTGLEVTLDAINPGQVIPAGGARSLCREANLIGKNPKLRSLDQELTTIGPRSRKHLVRRQPISALTETSPALSFVQPELLYIPWYTAYRRPLCWQSTQHSLVGKTGRLKRELKATGSGGKVQVRDEGTQASKPSLKGVHYQASNGLLQMLVILPVDSSHLPVREPPLVQATFALSESFACGAIRGDYAKYSLLGMILFGELQPSPLALLVAQVTVMGELRTTRWTVVNFLVDV
ncbi:hypothetical protein DFP72DRAFT_845717 [Ephemerocybe angulata]|uniref:Uncharacterized protein n=1 Tax=Ephemerocybe angulata TaxID=980116 RepID=A0A8H6I351_9AGAR|nr:hypothetical protein DFP72DRAFT_845717 [Tulosesus angulatus]